MSLFSTLAHSQISLDLDPWPLLSNPHQGKTVKCTRSQLHMPLILKTDMKQMKLSSTLFKLKTLQTQTKKMNHGQTLARSLFLFEG